MVEPKCFKAKSNFQQRERIVTISYMLFDPIFQSLRGSSNIDGITPTSKFVDDITQGRGRENIFVCVCVEEEVLCNVKPQGLRF